MEKNNQVKEIIQLKNLIVNKESREILIDNNTLKLTQKEYEVLLYLVENVDLPLTREQLVETIWGFDFEGEDRVVDDLVKRLRKNLRMVVLKLKLLQSGVMDIKLKTNNSISKRIMIGFIGILIITFIITTILYSAFSEKVVVSQAKSELVEASEFIEQNLLSMFGNNVNERSMNARLVSNISLISKFLNMQTILINEDSRVIYPRDGWNLNKVELFKKNLRLEDNKYILYET